jgi:hypothetical protein
MSENESALGEGTAEATEPEVNTEEITYHAVEKDGVVTAIWEMQGRQGQDILRLYTTEHHDEATA